MKTLLIPSLIVLSMFSIQTNAQTCVLACPPNIIVKADSAKGNARVNYNPLENSADCGSVTYTPASGSLFKIGSTSVIGTNSKGDRCSFTILVTDNEAPSISPLTFSVQKVWPANGKMKEVAVAYTAKDNADSCVCTLSVTSNDAEGKRSWEIVNSHLVKLAAARLPDGTPRVYTITATCTDEAGNSARRSKTIAVAKNVAKR